MTLADATCVAAVVLLALAAVAIAALVPGPVRTMIRRWRNL